MVAVAIDGPSGAGKSTIAKAAAKQLGLIYVDTGALYRTVGYAMAREGTNLADEDAVKQVLSRIRVTFSYDEQGSQRVYLNGEDVSEKIRTPEMSMMASRVSALSSVRVFLLDLQRDTAKRQSVIMDGRDIGTVVLPDADVKIFLTASPQIRAKRRHQELVEKGQQVTFEEVLNDVLQRDYNDSHREIAPLKQADDAVLLDTSGYTLEKSIEEVVRIIKEAAPCSIK
mgnify:FL=1